MAELVPPDEIYVPFQEAIDFDIYALLGVITGEVKYLRATPKREAADALYDALLEVGKMASYALALADGKEVE